MTDGTYLEARLLAMLLAHPGILDDERVTIDADWFTVREYARIYRELRRHRHNDVNVFELSKEERHTALTLLLYEAFEPENLFVYMRELERRNERLAFRETTRKLAGNGKTTKRLFDDIA